MHENIVYQYNLPSLSSCSINWLETKPHPDIFKWVKFGQHSVAIRRPTLNSWYGWPPPSTKDESASVMTILIHLKGKFYTVINWEN